MDNTLHLLIMYTMLVLMLILLHKGRKDRRSRYLAIYAFIEVLTNSIDSITIWAGPSIYEKIPAIPFLAKPISLLWVPVFFFYIETCFSEQFRIKKLHLLNLLPFALAQLLFIALRILRNGNEIATNIFNIHAIEGLSLYMIDIIIRMQYLIYNIYIIIQLVMIEKENKQHRGQKKLNANIGWIRFIVYGYALACTGATVTFVLFHFNWQLATLINRYSILYFFLFFFLIFYNTIISKSTQSAIKEKILPNDTSELSTVMLQLNAFLNQNPLYLNAELTLKQVSEALNTKERIISLAINTLQNRTFKDYINEKRIQHAIDLLGSTNDKAVFEVMYESGFSSKAPFNAAFKKFTGKTPSEFRNTIEKE